LDGVKDSNMDVNGVREGSVGGAGVGLGLGSGSGSGLGLGLGLGEIEFETVELDVGIFSSNQVSTSSGSVSTSTASSSASPSASFPTSLSYSDHLDHPSTSTSASTSTSTSVLSSSSGVGVGGVVVAPDGTVGYYPGPHSGPEADLDLDLESEAPMQIKFKVEPDLESNSSIDIKREMKPESKRNSKLKREMNVELDGLNGDGGKGGDEQDIAELGKRRRRWGSGKAGLMVRRSEMRREGKRAEGGEEEVVVPAVEGKNDVVTQTQTQVMTATAAAVITPSSTASSLPQAPSGAILIPSIPTTTGATTTNDDPSSAFPTPFDNTLSYSLEDGCVAFLTGFLTSDEMEGKVGDPASGSGAAEQDDEDDEARRCRPFAMLVGSSAGWAGLWVSS